MSAPLRYATCTVDLDRARVHTSSGAEGLTALEVDLLRRLAQRFDTPVATPTLLDEVWGYGSNANTRAVSSTIQRLRRKLEGDAPEPLVLRNVRGVGWLLATPEQRTNLGPEPDRFFGRTAEQRQVLAALERSRVVTVVGLDGIGKTRLARRVGRRVTDREVWFCALAGVPDAVALCYAVAETLGLEKRGGPRGVVDEVGDGLLGRGAMLLVLDEADELVEATAAVVSRWIDRCPQLTVLVTSQLQLGIQGEDAVELGTLAPAVAVALFEDRAPASALPSTEAERRTLVERLDCVPLAVELAAAGATVLSAAELIRQVETPQDLAGGPMEDARSIGRSIEASWQRLSEDAQRVLAQCTVFEAPFDMGAARATVRPDGELATAMFELVECSLLTARREEASVVYAMLTMVRAHAASHLSAPERADALRRRAHYFAREARRRCRFEGPDSPEDLRWLRRAAPHLLALVHADDAPADCRVDAAIGVRWTLGEAGEGLRAVELLRAVVDTGASPARTARCHAWLALAEARAGRWNAAAQRLAAARDLVSADDVHLAIDVDGLALTVGRLRGEVETRAAEAEALLRRAQVHERPYWQSVALLAIGYAKDRGADPVVRYEYRRRALASVEGRCRRRAARLRGLVAGAALELRAWDEARAHVDVALAELQALGLERARVLAMFVTVTLHLRFLRATEAREVLRRCEAAATRLGHEDLHCDALAGLAAVAADLGERERAAAHGERALGIARRAGFGDRAAVVRHQLALLRLDEGRYEEAEALLDAGDVPDSLAMVRARVAKARALLELLRGRPERALARGPGFEHDDEAVFGRALALALTGRPEEARGALAENPRATDNPRSKLLYQLTAAGLTLMDPGAEGAHAGRARAELARDLPPSLTARLVHRVAMAESARAAESAVPTLTRREAEVLELAARGSTTREMQDALGLRRGTIKTHVNHLLRKLAATDRADAVARARRLGLLPTGE